MPPASCRQLDPTPIFELFRGNYATELLTAAVAHFDLFARLAQPAASAWRVAPSELELAERPAVVLTGGAAGDGPVAPQDPAARLNLTDRWPANIWCPAASSTSAIMSGWSAESRAWSRWSSGCGPTGPRAPNPRSRAAAFIYRAGLDSAMEKEATARRFTLALGRPGRERRAGPCAAAFLWPARGCCSTSAAAPASTALPAWSVIRDLQAIVWDRPEVLKVAAEMARRRAWPTGWNCRPGDMFADPSADRLRC